MDVMTAITQRRSIRRFQNKPVPENLLRELISLGRLHASGGNAQPIRWGIVAGDALREAVFQQLKWAMYLPDFEILEYQRPQAYLVLFQDANSKKQVGFDTGAAATTVMLAAEAMGLGTCCMASFREAELSCVLGVEGTWKPVLVIALGYPDQKSSAVPYTDTIRYRENADGDLEVPKFSLEEVLVYTG